MEDYMKNEHNEEHNHEHDCDCGCDHNHEATMTIVTEDGEELKCTVLGIFDVDDKEYIAILPIGEEEVLLYRYVENSENEEDFELLNIETDEEFAEVEKAFFDIFGEENFEDDEQ